MFDIANHNSPFLSRILCVRETPYNSKSSFFRVLTMEVSVCSGNCNINLEHLFDIVLCDRNSAIRFLVIYGVGLIKNEYCCLKCGSLLILNKHGKFRCDNKVYIGGEQTRCRVLSSGLKGIFFEHARISFEKIIEVR